MRKISKTKIEKRLQKKVNPVLRSLIIKLKKQDKPFWQALAKELARPKRIAVKVNLMKISKVVKGNETIVVPGKVLATGTLSKQIRIAAFSFSESAREKIRASGGKTVSIEELIKKPDKNMKLIR